MSPETSKVATGFLTLLAQLTVVGEVSESEFGGDRNSRHVDLSTNHALKFAGLQSASSLYKLNNQTIT